MSAKSWISIPGKTVETHPVKRIRRIPVVTIMDLSISVVTRPKIEVITALDRVFDGSGKPPIGKKPVGADQVDMLMPLFVVVRPFVDMPYE